MKYARALLCELLFGLALKVAPDGYTPTFVEAVIAAREGKCSSCRE